MKSTGKGPIELWLEFVGMIIMLGGGLAALLVIILLVSGLWKAESYQTGSHGAEVSWHGTPTAIGHRRESRRIWVAHSQPLVIGSASTASSLGECIRLGTRGAAPADWDWVSLKVGQWLSHHLNYFSNLHFTPQKQGYSDRFIFALPLTFGHLWVILYQWKRETEIQN